MNYKQDIWHALSLIMHYKQDILHALSLIMHYKQDILHARSLGMNPIRITGILFPIHLDVRLGK
jgi:formate dehydrogenase maturation protein FdhE